MNFFIITPSYNQQDLLQNCIASVAAQQCYDDCVHHHVQDAVSTDGTGELLEKTISCLQVNPLGYNFSYCSEKDDGMYDALNMGIRNTGASFGSEIVSWLNCDEQYLPGTLQKVADYFRKNPETDILFGGMLVIEETGELLSCRRAMPMRKVFLEASYLYNYSCAMFFRRSLWEKLGGFDTAYKNAGDEDLIRRALASGAKTAVLDEYLSVFTYGEGNLSSEPSAVEEHRLLKQNNSGWVQLFRPVINAIRLGEKWIRGGHRQKGPIEYEIYVEGSVERKKFVCENPSCQWPGHTKPYMLHHRLDT